MGIMKKLMSLFSEKNTINYSKLTNISSRYGILQVQAYQDREDEYLAIMSKKFFELKTPIVYIHSNFHQHNDPHSNIRYVNNEINSILNIIAKEGGLIIYHSKSENGIENLLKKINAKKLQNEPNTTMKANFPLCLKNKQREYQVLGAMLQNLKLNSIQLISYDSDLTLVLKQLNIKIHKRKESVTYQYG